MLFFIYILLLLSIYNIITIYFKGKVIHKKIQSKMKNKESFDRLSETSSCHISLLFRNETNFDIWWTNHVNQFWFVWNCVRVELSGLGFICQEKILTTKFRPPVWRKLCLVSKHPPSDIIDQNTKKRIKSIFPKSVQVGIPSDSEFNQSSITINNYTFPNTDGTDQQVISTDGNGNLYWGSVSGEPGPQGETGPTGATGADGESGSGVTINLNPGSVLLIANSTGTVSDYTPSGATIEVYENGVQLGIHNIATPDNSSFKIGTLSGTSITPGSVTQTSGSFQATVSDASSMTQDTASITHPVTVKNKFGTSTTYDVIQTLAKAKQGADGTDGRDGASGSAVAVYKVNSVNSQIT